MGVCDGELCEVSHRVFRVLDLAVMLLLFRNVETGVAKSSLILFGVVFSGRDCLEAGLGEIFGVNGGFDLIPLFAEALRLGSNGRLLFGLSYEGIFGLPDLAVNIAASFCDTTRIMTLLLEILDDELMR